MSGRVTSFGFAALHAGAGIFILYTLLRGSSYAELIGIGIRSTNWHPLLGLLPLAVSVVLLIVAVTLATSEARESVRRWRLGEPEVDVLLRVRALGYLGLACILVNALFFSTAETFSGPFRLRYPVVGSITLAFAYGVFVLWYRLLPRLRRVVPGAVRRAVDLVGMNVSLIVVLAEGSLRVVSLFWASPLLVTESMPSQVRRDASRERPGTIWFGFPMNRGGHYDTEFVPSSEVPGPLVVSIGDSFSYGAVPHQYHFTTVAERERPGVEIYNMGFSAIGPADYLYLLEQEALPLKPDLIVVQLFVGNDVAHGSKPAGGRRWYDAGSYRLAVVWHRLRNMSQAGMTSRRAAAQPPSPGRESLEKLFPYLTDPLLEKPSVTRAVFLDLETDHAEEIASAAPRVYHRFFGVLEEMERAAGDVPVKFVLIPEEYQVEDDVWEEVVQRSGQPLDRDQPQRRILEWAASRGRPVLDLLPVLRAAAPLEDGRRHLYHLHNLHFNARGNAIAGRALAAFLDSLPRARLPLHLEFGSGLTRRVLHSGWQEDEVVGDDTFVWSDGLRSVLTVPLRAGDDIVMDFEAFPFEFPDSPEQEVTILLNGTEVGARRLRPGRHRYSVTLPRSSVRDSINTLEFRYAYARAPRDVRPGSTDTRLLGVGWHSIDFRARPSDANAPTSR
jgi:hypothetical protein